AREAELCYAAINLVTDYDCWRPPRGELDQQALLREIRGHLGAATAAALALLRSAIPAVGRLAASGCSCQEALSQAVWTAPAHIHEETRERLGLLPGGVLTGGAFLVLGRLARLAPPRPGRGPVSEPQPAQRGDPDPPGEGARFPRRGQRRGQGDALPHPHPPQRPPRPAHRRDRRGLEQ